MGCVDTHQGGLAIIKCDSPSRIRSIVEKFGEYNKKKGWENWFNYMPNIHPKGET
jgi:hypothetical protein